MSDERTMPGHGSMRPPAGNDGVVPLALAAGLVAALIGGAVWAAIGIFFNLEIGWAAWGIGVLVGGAMVMVTPERNRSLAVAAAVLALVGLLGGKAMAFAGGTGPLADEIMESPENLRGMMAWQLYENGALDPAVQDAVTATYESGDTLSDALWAEMLGAADAELDRVSPEEKRAMAEAAAGAFIQSTGLVAGVRMQLSGFDLLWLFLALATAFKIVDEPLVEEESPVEAREREPIHR